MDAPVVIVGASAAGLATAESIQRLAPERPVIVVGDEPGLAHDRPPLSKQVLEGIWPPERAHLLPPVRLDGLKARLLLGRRAVGLNVARRAIEIDDGSTFEFSDLVIATGVRPRTLPGSAPAGVHVLRNLADSQALRSALLRDNARLAVVGAGFLGLEVAATAKKMGVAATVVEAAPGGLAARLGNHAAARLLTMHRTHGVDFRFDVGVAGFEVDAANHVVGLTLTDGTSIAASVVLVAIGCAPNVEWLSESSLDIGNGVRCDEYCRAAPGVWAVGDVARWLHVALGRHIRIEHRLNASEQAAAVAANIVGPVRPYTPTPFFWTDQYDARLQLAGAMQAGDTEMVEALGGGSYIHTFHSNGRLSAALGWNAAKALMPLRRELASHFSVS